MRAPVASGFQNEEIQWGYGQYPVSIETEYEHFKQKLRKFIDNVSVN